MFVTVISGISSEAMDMICVRNKKSNTEMIMEVRQWFHAHLNTDLPDGWIAHVTTVILFVRLFRDTSAMVTDSLTD